MYIFVKEKFPLQILLIPFFEDTLSFLYNVNNDILSVFHLDIQVFMSNSWYKFWKTFGFVNHDKFKYV